MATAIGIRVEWAFFLLFVLHMDKVWNVAKDNENSHSAACYTYLVLSKAFRIKTCRASQKFQHSGLLGCLSA